jgi:hypothetical protein
MERAYISVIQPKPGGSEISRVKFMYNPKEFSYTKTASWERKPAKGAKKAPPLEFKGVQPSSLTVEVFLDGYETGTDISRDIKTLTTCCQPLASTIQPGKPSPPWVIFGWGSTVHLTAYVKSVAVKCTMFDREGVPLRALCTVTMEEVAPDAAPQNPTSGAITSTRSYQMVAGDSLASVAYREYGEAGRWRALAEANNVDDPMRLPPGTRLLVPELDALEMATT